MLEVLHLTKTYGSFRALSEVSFTAHAGGITGLLGPNGAGKSTLIHCLCGLVDPDAGEILWQGEPVDRGWRRRSLGFCPDDLPMPDLLTGREYLDLVAGLRGVPAQSGAPLEGAVEEMATGLGLAAALDSLIATYSHGMKRKIQLIAALVHGPEVLVLDEPFRGLDPESAAILKSLLRRLADDGRMVLISTHDLLVAEQMCSRVVVLAQGELLIQAAPGDLVSDRAVSLEESFLDLTGLGARAVSSADLFFDGLGALGHV